VCFEPTIAQTLTSFFGLVLKSPTPYQSFMWVKPSPVIRFTAILLGWLASTSAHAQTSVPDIAALKEIALRGHPVAQFNLGVMLDTGQGAAQDFTQAARWYRLAAKQGHAAAQFNLGGLYYEGQGVPRDLVRASVWFSLAAVAGFEGAARNRNGVAGMLKPDELARTQTLVRTCQQSLLADCD
jgi:hypothetical protein